MVRPRLSLLLPSLSVIVTSALWLLARSEYLRVACPPSGACNGWHWTDYTPFSIRVAGMLNVPVAIFATPLYHLLQESIGHIELIALLTGVAALWTYIGWILDARKAAPQPRSVLRTILGVLGLLFGAFLLLVTMPMFHVGLLYKAVTLIWIFVIVRHFLLFFRNPATASRR
jgi:hypothetical protein